MRVQGEGNPLATLLFIGEAPGVEEDRTGRPFVGKAGRELDRFLNGYDLPPREEVFITNLVRERPTTAAGQNREPTQAEIERDWPELQLELTIIEPAIIVTLGRTSTRALLGDVDLETVHGIPHGALPTIFPAYHPAAALHSPELQALLAYDMHRLSLLLLDQLTPHVRDNRPGLYGEDEQQGLEPDKPIAIDTEGWVEKPWGLSFSQAEGEGWVTRSHFGLACFQKDISQQRAPIYLHNALHDLSVLKRLGITLPHFTDTMILAYLLGLEPQGLKPLAYRHAGMVQSSYDEVIAAASGLVETRWLELVTLPEKVKARGRKSKVG